MVLSERLNLDYEFLTDLCKEDFVAHILMYAEHFESK